MLNLENIRLDSSERYALSKAIDDINEEVYMIGSRVDLKKRGGDIDILIYSKENSFNLARKIRRRFFLECEEKIDIVVFNKDALTDTQRAFINTLKIVRIK